MPGAGQAALTHFTDLKARYSRWRRGLKRRVIERAVLRKPAVRDVVLAQLSERGHLLYCEVPQGCFFVDPADQSVGRDLLLKGGWDAGLFDTVTDLLARAGRFRQGGTFVNIGANIGVQVVSALKGGHFARAVAFEPEPGNAALLERNVALNGFEDRVTIRRTALGEAAGRGELRLHPRNKGAHSLSLWPSVDGREVVSVPVERADAALSELGVTPAEVTLMLIDVEGFEPQVVAGLGDWLAQRIPLLIEFAPQRYTSEQRDAFVARLSAHYTQCHALNTGETAPRGIAALASIDRFTDVLID
jgi:FkbM family methyltransferase